MIGSTALVLVGLVPMFATGPAAGASPAVGTIVAFADSTGDGGFSGDGGPALTAKLNAPQGMIVDSAGNLVVADTNNGRIRVIAKQTGTFYGQAMTAGNIYSIAGTGARGYSGDGGPATDAVFNLPQGVAVDNAGDIVVADTNNNVVRVIAESTGNRYATSMVAGSVYTVAGTGAFSFSGDGGPAKAATFADLQAAEVDGSGNLLIADANNDRIRVMAASSGTFYGQAMTAGDVYTIAGNGSSNYSGSGIPALSSGLGNPNIAVPDAQGNLVVNGYLDQHILVIAEHTGTFYGMAMTAGDIYLVAGNGQIGSSPNGTPAAQAEFCYPNTLVVDAAGNIVIADLFNNEIRVLAESTGSYYGMAMTAGDVYTIAGDPNRYSSFGDGGPATAAGLDEPGTVALDQSGNLYEAEMDEPNPPNAPVSGTSGSSRIREIIASAPVVASPGAPTGLTATPGDTTVHLSWASSTIGGTPADYV
ncbi:MAG: hypothetical protein JO337_03230, partial [Acidimicrobiales bacterium]|nr:hypothetical protein [Acidimicrobiales bacterium]